MVTDILYLIERMIGYMAFLEVKNLTRIYGKKENQLTALDHVSFSVERGEFVAVTGASGSGKSTLLHLLGTMDDAQVLLLHFLPQSLLFQILRKMLLQCLQAELLVWE